MKKTMPASIHHDLFIYNLQFRYYQPKAPQFIVHETSTWIIPAELTSVTNESVSLRIQRKKYYSKGLQNHQNKALPGKSWRHFPASMELICIQEILHHKSKINNSILFSAVVRDSL